MKKIDYCKFFADIEADPKAITPRLTVRQFLEAKKHVHTCHICHASVNRVLAQHDKLANDNRSMN